MNLGYYVHLKNKYPDCDVQAKGEDLDVYSKDGAHLVALRKNGAGQLLDHSEILGCDDVFDLSPIPRTARLFKVKDGKVVKDEDYESRMKTKKEFMSGLKVMSCEEMKKLGFEFDSKGDVSKKPE